MRSLLLYYSGLFIFLMLVILPACRSGGDNKDVYLKNYRNLMKELESRCGKTDLLSNDSFWQDMDDQIYEFSGIYYWRHFENLTYKERLEINQFPVMYYLCRYKSVVNERVQFEFQSEVETLVKGLTEIMDSTATIYKDYDSGIRDILHEFKGRGNNR
ncbi:MAG: hypothetical protein IPM47_19735 [Sphingobacteriales bacterium]|nr:MAG: hypothetical protein IPM47_19735 [Sphingobacteriales bacterium]